MEHVLLADRQAHLSHALAAGAQDYEPIDVAAGLDDWLNRLGADPTESPEARAARRRAELMAQVV